MFFRDGLPNQKKLIVRLLLTSAVALPLAGCKSLPSNGPTAGHIERVGRSVRNTLGYHIVDITPALVQRQKAPTAPDELGLLGATTKLERSDIIRVGDTLSISIFEVGISLFGGATSAASITSQQVDQPSGSAQHMTVRVDDDGSISLPYIGSISAAGLKPQDVQTMIERRLHGMSQSPQALVTIADSVEDSVYLSGAVAKPGRYRLSAAKERLLDMLAMAGGPSVDIEDAELRFVRGTHIVRARLGDLQLDSVANIALAPGDRVEVVKRPRSFTVFGATDKVSQIPFGTHAVSLSEAIARAGGPSDSRANPRHIFLFRFEPAGDGASESPVIYQLNMMDPQSYFLAQRFALNDKDLIYFSNSSSNLPAKFINLINLMTSPLITARVAAGVP